MKYSAELAQQIAQLIEDGNFAKVAAAASGISEETFYRWQRLTIENGSPNPEYKQYPPKQPLYKPAKKRSDNDQKYSWFCQ